MSTFQSINFISNLNLCYNAMVVELFLMVSIGVFVE